MNYLAHAYLSFNNPDILVGNMISDFVKGKKQFDFPPSIQQGIQLHRAIDSFTDLHPATKEAKLLLKPAVGAYAGAFMDIVYDHFLALDANELSEPAWKEFAALTYQQLFARETFLPDKFARMLPYMASQNWLFNYRYPEGIEKSFGGLVRRAAYLEDHRAVFDLFIEHYNELGIHYKKFFPDVKKYAKSYLVGRLLE
jgi:acyl carrier protein phosphodiesterase